MGVLQMLTKLPAFSGEYKMSYPLIVGRIHIVCARCVSQDKRLTSRIDVALQVGEGWYSDENARSFLHTNSIISLCHFGEPYFVGYGLG